MKDSSVYTIAKIPGTVCLNAFLKNVEFPNFSELYLQKLENKNKVKTSKRVTKFNYEHFHQKLLERKKGFEKTTEANEEAGFTSPVPSIDETLETPSSYCVTQNKLSSLHKNATLTKYNHDGLRERLNEKKKLLIDSQDKILVMQSPPSKKRKKSIGSGDVESTSSLIKSFPQKAVFKSQILPDNDSCEEDAIVNNEEDDDDDDDTMTKKHNVLSSTQKLYNSPLREFGKSVALQQITPPNSPLSIVSKKNNQESDDIDHQIYKTPVNSELKILMYNNGGAAEKCAKKSSQKQPVTATPLLVSPKLEDISVNSPVVFKSPNKIRYLDKNNDGGDVLRQKSLQSRTKHVDGVSNSGVDEENDFNSLSKKSDKQHSQHRFPSLIKNRLVQTSNYKQVSTSSSNFSGSSCLSSKCSVKSNIKNTLRSFGSNSVKSFSAQSNNVISCQKGIRVDEEDADEELFREEDEKRELLIKFQLLRQKNEALVSGYSFNMRSDIKVMRNTYKLILKELSMSSRIDNFQTYLLAGFIFIEIGLGKFGFDMEGFSKQQIESIKSYDDLLNELGEREYASAFTKKWPVELRLCGMIAFNAVLFIIAKSLQGSKQLNIFGLLNSNKPSSNNPDVVPLDRGTNSKQMKGLNNGVQASSF